MGLDAPIVAFSYSTLGMYYHSCGYFSRAFDYMHRALNILQLSCGDQHPEISSVYANLAIMYQETENNSAAILALSHNLSQT